MLFCMVWTWYAISGALHFLTLSQWDPLFSVNQTGNLQLGVFVSRNISSTSTTSTIRDSIFDRVSTNFARWKLLVRVFVSGCKVHFFIRDTVVVNQWIFSEFGTPTQRSGAAVTHQNLFFKVLRLFWQMAQLG